MFRSVIESLGMGGKFLAVVTAAVVVGGATTAIIAAAIPDSSGVIHACYATKDGSGLRLIDSDAGQACTSKETIVTWNQTGPQGPQGQQGPAGPGTGSVVANQVQIVFDSLHQSDTPVAILTVPDFGVYEATQCDSAGGAVLQYHNTTSHIVYNDGSEDGVVAPGAAITLRQSTLSTSLLTEGSGSNFRELITNYSVYQYQDHCTFFGQATENTEAQG